MHYAALLRHTIRAFGLMLCRAEGAGACLSVATIWRYIKQLCDHICSHVIQK